VDYVATCIGLVGTATPAFLVALVFLFLANKYLGMSLGGLYSDEYLNAPWSLGKVLDLLSHLWLPVLILSIGALGGMIRTVRANLLDQMELPYVDTARAKGLPEWKVILKYPTRIAINPLISTIGWMLPQMISATVIVDVVLSLPTTGPLLLKSLMAQDMYLAGALVMMLSVLTMIGTLVSDVLLAWVDPRIRFEAGGH
jgi:peptide/nickel transport system permease protein